MLWLLDLRLLGRPPEFLKGATVRSRKTVQRLRTQYVFLNAKMNYLSLFYLFWVIFNFCLLVFDPFCLRKTFEQKYRLRNKKILLESMWSSSSWTSSLRTLCSMAAPMRAGPVGERMVKGKPQNPVTLTLSPSVTTISEHDFMQSL